MVPATDGWAGLAGRAGILPALLAVLATAPEAKGQGALERTPNLTGGWVGEPGALHFNVVHRFWVSGDNLLNSPTILLGVPLPGRLLAGAQYASNSNVAPGGFNEWELFGRWAPIRADERGVDAALAGAYNRASGSADGEVSVALPLGPVRLLGAGRLFSDARGSGDLGGSVAGGAAFRLRDGLALAGDLGAVWIGDDDRATIWGAGLQLRIPTTPHTVSLQATNTRTSTLQGSASRGRTTWGFEFTVPITFARYIGRDRQPAAPDEAEGEVEITMTDDLRFAPDTVEVEAGTTVVWRNTTPIIHTVTADPEALPPPEARPEGVRVEFPDEAEPFDSGNLMEDDVFRYTFTEPGEYLYVCLPHLPIMVGVVRVVEPG